MMTINNISTETKTLQTQLTIKQQNLNKLSSDAEMATVDKEKERRKIKQEIAELNRKLKQERLKERGDNKKLQKEQEKKKVIKEEFIQEMYSDEKEDSKVSKDSASTDKQEGSKNAEDTPVVMLKNILSADSAIRLSTLEDNASRNREREQAVLATEIQSDELHGMDTTSKEEALSNMRRKEQFTIESLHKKEDTSVPTMDLGAKIIIRE